MLVVNTIVDCVTVLVLSPICRESNTVDLSFCFNLIHALTVHDLMLEFWQLELLAADGCTWTCWGLKVMRSRNMEADLLR